MAFLKNIFKSSTSTPQVIEEKEQMDQITQATKELALSDTYEMATLALS
jgi:hypothetical protein